MTIPVLRSLGSHLHPVGPLTVANMVNDPDCKIADGSGNLTSYQATNCQFVQDSSMAKFEKTSGKYTALSTSAFPTVIQSFQVQESTDYTASMYVNIPAALSTGYSIFGQLYAFDGTAMGISGGQVLNGSATSGWVRTSILLSTVPGTTRMDVAFIFPSAQPSALDSFNADGFQLEPYSSVGTFVTGDMSGYCWAGAKGQSYTLKTQFPSALRTFNIGPLSGTPSGMVAKGTMIRPNIINLQS